MQEDKLVLILEDMRSDFRAFKEGLSIVSDGLKNVKEELHDFKEEMRDFKYIMAKEFREFKEETRGMNKFLQDMMSEHEKWLQDHEVRIRFVEKKIA